MYGGELTCHEVYNHVPQSNMYPRYRSTQYSLIYTFRMVLPCLVVIQDSPAETIPWPTKLVVLNLDTPVHDCEVKRTTQHHASPSPLSPTRPFFPAYQLNPLLGFSSTSHSFLSSFSRGQGVEE